VKHLLLCAGDSTNELRAEVSRAWPASDFQEIKPLVFEAAFPIHAGDRLPFLPHARQFLPNAAATTAESIRGWSEQLLRVIAAQVPENQPWTLHVEPHYGAQPVRRMGARAWHSALRRGSPPRPQGAHGDAATDPAAGKNRCRLITVALRERLQQKRRHLLKHLRAAPEPFSTTETLVQVCLTGPGTGYISVAPSPMPFKNRHVISFLPLGRIEVASDKAAPSRAFAKLIEAETRLGRHIRPGERCVDLGAAPGSWTYVAAARGARVLAVDRSPLRQDLMMHPAVEFVSQDAFRFVPPRPVDWLLCDVIAEPARTAELLAKWLRNKWCQAFVVTLKLKDSLENVAATESLAAEVMPFASDLRLTHLCANKKEVCVYGVRAENQPQPRQKPA
jgi:23S rRNA (cytidine2498-2'-O)-methyltransferase